MKAFWDERYQAEHYIYGKEPNVFFASALQTLRPGRILLPAEGEGRNAVYAASGGWNVDAFDQSTVASLKAKNLAEESGVQFEYRVSTIKDYSFPADRYDAAGLIFVHLPPAERARLHKQVCRALRPGGSLILEAFHLSQLGNGSGGPQSTELLFDEEMLRNDFSGLEIMLLETRSVILDEGALHSGEAAVIRLIAQKRKS